MNHRSPTVRRRKEGTSALRTTTERRPPDALDHAHQRIASFAEANGHGIGVRKDRHGYTLFREASGDPVARLRPQGEHQYAVLYWSRFGQRWRTIGDFGDMILGLDAALDFIAVDPMGCFWF